jgi:glycine/D-amino acid oxidase-like deaminating enzyme
MPAVPSHAHYLIIGAGIHGLSTAMHLGERLKAQGKSVGAGGTRIVVLDKTGIGAGASGIACGVVRNNYYQPAMRELMAHSVSVGGARSRVYSYHPWATCRSARR